jgi:UDP-2,4-diacetamido-2,4,6-trideoxy-beta-L-altropyranose hydrolase
VSKAVAFRVDASLQIGTGHLMRCLTLAVALKQHGAHVHFVCRHLPEHLANQLSDAGISWTVLPAMEGPLDELPHSAWLGCSQGQDAEATLVALSGAKWDALVVDHYALDHRWHGCVRQSIACLMVIDDLADRVHACDLLLDQNLQGDEGARYQGRVPDSCRQLLGPNHALLRPEFARLRAGVKLRTGDVRRILVFFGGMDAGNDTLPTVQALAQMPLEGKHVDVVIGAQHPARPAVEHACKQAGFTCHVQTPHMAELTAEADFAICAGGIALWERCCLGLPTLTVATAANQLEQVRHAARLGAVHSPLLAIGDVDGLMRHIASAIQSPDLLHAMSRTAMGLVDGKGAQRAARALLSTLVAPYSPPLVIEPAVEADAELAWRWRNDPAVRQTAFCPDPIPWGDHLRWWLGSLSNPRRALLLGKLDKVAVGVLRFDFDEQLGAVVSIYIDPERTGQGIGKALLRAGVSWLGRNRPDVRQVFAEILPENMASQALFRSVGFVERQKTVVLSV